MQQNNSKQSGQSEIELGFLDILQILLNSKGLIIFTTIAFGAIGLFYSLYFHPVLPKNIESSSVVEIGSYSAPYEMLSNSRNGRILIASMEASVTRLNAVFKSFKVDATREGSSISNNFNYTTDGMKIQKKLHYDDLIQQISIFELDSQYLKIEIVGSTINDVKNKTYEIVEYLKTLHSELLDEVILKKKREVQYIEEILLTINKFIGTITQGNNIYLSDVAELKLKEIEYNHKLVELNNYLAKVENFKKTDLVSETVFWTNYSESKTTNLVVTSLIIGIILSSLFIIIRHSLIENHKE